MNPFYLGIDVSKGYADFMILNAKKQPMGKNFQLDDTFEGHSQLYQCLDSFFKNNPDAQLLAAVESTGGYENNWYNSLLSFQATLNIRTARLNPRAVHHNQKAAMNRIMTDPISARNIAEYLISHPEKISYQTEDPLASLRKQFSFIQLLTKQRTQLLNQLESLLYSCHPELLAFCKDGLRQWVLKLLVKYPTAEKLTKAKADCVAKIPYISIERAQELIDHAKESVACQSDTITNNLVTHYAKQILQLSETIDLQAKLMAHHFEHPEIAQLKTLPGISDYSAIGLLLEIQTVKRFSSSKKLASFFGLHPVFKMSGDGLGGFRMSKQGRKNPRRLLFMVTLNAIQTNESIRETYQYHIKRGMNKMAAIGLCMHKTIRIIYGMLKNNTDFNPETDRKNRQRSKPIKRRVKQETDRRYQSFDPKAPISRRQLNKRRQKIKEQRKSQSDLIAENGIIAVAPNIR
jgi:transposase